MTPWLNDMSDYTPLGAFSQAIQDSIQGSFPPAALLLTLAGYAIAFGFPGRPLLPLGVTMHIPATPGVPRRRSPRPVQHVAI